MHIELGEDFAIRAFREFFEFFGIAKAGKAAKRTLGNRVIGKAFGRHQRAEAMREINDWFNADSVG